MKSRMLPILLLAVVIGGYILLELFGPQGDNWTPKYGMDHDEPFGSMLVYEGMGDLFPEEEILIVDAAPSEQLLEFEENPTNYVFIQQSLDMNREDASALMKYVRNGNDVFIAAASFEGHLGDSLNLRNDNFWDLVAEKKFTKDDYVYFGEAYDPDEKHFELLDNIYYEVASSWTASEVLGSNRDGQSIFFRIDKGEGSFYIHTIPLLFTNYYMVDEVNHEYISKAFSFLSERKTYWDEYYKPGRLHVKSPVSFILNQQALQWAWYLLLASIVLFVIFEGKRRQRSIPVVEPPANDTLEFTKTVSRLYFLHGDHKDIASKKVKFLNEYIRNRWGIPTRTYDEDFRHRLSQKSGVNRQLINEIYDAAYRIDDAKKIDQDSLHALHRAIEAFYQKAT